MDVLGSQRNSTEQGTGRHGVCADGEGTMGPEAHPKYKQISLVWLRPHFRLDRLWKTPI